MKSVVLGTGSYLPERVLTNFDLEKMVDTSDEWIVQRSGIRERRIAAENETTGDMAIIAARRAVEASGLQIGDIDGVIVATTTPDKTFPSTAVRVQAELGISSCMAFDVQAVCSGFIYALSIADSFVKTGQAKNIIVVGAEKMSSIIDWKDRSTCVLFSDGAGAMVVSALDDSDNPKGTAGRGIHSTHIYADGQGRELLFTDGGVSTTGTAGKIVMNGREVFKTAVNNLSSVVCEVLEHNGIKASDIDWLVPHQANIRIIESTAKKLGMPMSKVIVTLDRQGNSSAASVPLAFDTAVREGKIKKGHLCLMEAMGGGLTWGAVLMRF